MSNIFKLDDIIAAANEFYANFPVDLGDGQAPVILRNVLQLSEDERKAIAAKDDDEDDTPENPDEVSEAEAPTVLERLREQVRMVADSPEGAERLIARIGDNLAHFMYLIKQYNEATQMGEASPSDD